MEEVDKELEKCHNIKCKLILWIGIGRVSNELHIEMITMGIQMDLGRSSFDG